MSDEEWQVELKSPGFGGVLWLTYQRYITGCAFIGVLLVIIVQIIPTPSRDNPPILNEPNWDSARTRELAERACFDCHSNETDWPLYSEIAPLSWYLANQVKDGRRFVNFSEWTDFRGETLAQQSETAIANNEMPPWDYRLLQPQSRLTEAEKRELIDGLIQTFLAQSTP